ncbi:MAG: tetratricopeptide repeat protein [Cellvibrionaceae bacterium]
MGFQKKSQSHAKSSIERNATPKQNNSTSNIVSAAEAGTLNSRDHASKDSEALTAKNKQPSSLGREQSRKQQKISPQQLREIAIKCHHSAQWDKAVNLYKAYLLISPEDVSIWSNLGATLRKQKRYQLAVSCYRRGLEYNPQDLVLLGNLANALKDLHQLEEAIELHKQVLQQKPDDIQALMNYACALRESGYFDEALEQLNKAKSLLPAGTNVNNPLAAGIEWERAQNLLYLGRYTEGWPAYEARWHTGELPQKRFPFPRWEKQSLKNKTVLLHTEQGYGDTILAARFIPLLKQQGATVILQCKPELHRVFEKIGADRIISMDAYIDNNLADYHCPLMSLMGQLNIQPDSIPEPAQLHIPKESQQKFQKLKASHSDKLKIGIVWSGSLTFANNHNRSIPLQQLLPLTAIPNTRFFSLQKGPRSQELKDSGADCVIHDLSNHLDDFADTAAAIDSLDVIVMTDSSVAHLATSLNKPVINLLNAVPYWLYALEEKTTPWYPMMTLVKQANNGCWDDVTQQAKLLLETRVTNKKSS